MIKYALFLPRFRHLQPTICQNPVLPAPFAPAISPGLGYGRSLSGNILLPGDESLCVRMRDEAQGVCQRVGSMIIAGVGRFILRQTAIGETAVVA